MPQRKPSSSASTPPVKPPNPTLVALENLEGVINDLGTKIQEETEARKADTKASDNRAKWFRRAMVVMAAFIAISLGAAYGSWQTRLTQDRDRCDTGNKFRSQFVELNQGTIDYIDAILALSAAVQAANPHVDLTPEQQEALAVGTKKFAELHAQQEKNLKAPEFAQRKCS